RYCAPNSRACWESHVSEVKLQSILQDSVDEVLEKMFFIRSFGEHEHHGGEPQVVAKVEFEGNPSGWLALSMTTSAARSVAADFLREEDIDLSEPQIGEVICELANMICG